ncbi:hypothetical protein [Caulobacter soli]|uniref:hypothetical protein n=1 Tax=Caulobacter soli TaxID=2708539 RepID=UPI0013ECCDBF|nr:hypothetical protein [Caulobacter soli]
MSPEIRARHSLAEGLLHIAADALSDFEINLIAEISARRRRFGLEAVVTDIEADVLAGAVTAMEADVLAGAVTAMEAAIRRMAAEHRTGFDVMFDRIQIELGATA